MTNCKEFILDDVMSITAIPLVNIPTGDVDSPVNRLTPTIDRFGFSPNLENSITIGLLPAISGGTLIPIMRRSGKAKDDESDSVSGRLHTVTVTCEVDERECDIWDDLLTLERTPSHLLLSFRDGSGAFVSSTKDTYLCNTERDGARITVTIRIQNLMGIQMLR